MASFSSRSSTASPRRRQSVNNTTNNRDRDAESELSLSLRQLSLATSSPVRSPLSSPRPSSASVKPSLSRSPSVASLRGAPRSPLNGSSTPSGRDSRSATPTLLRKASLNSLHSASGVAPPRRASSVNLMSPSSLRSPLSAMTPEIPEKPPVTAASIANSCFKAELAHHHGENSSSPAEAIVILHDSCYGHRYSRPRTSKSALSTIVERPERIKASVLGVSLAYVRLGERHADGMYPLYPRLDPASIPSVPFRIHKTARKLPLMSPAVTHVHGTKWMEELKIMCDSAEAKLAMNGKELQRPDMDRGPNNSDTPPKLHEGDLYLCAESLDALEGALGGVCEAVDAVFRPTGPRRAFVAIRPPGHHCSASYPSGFCWINNVHVGIMHATLSHGLTHAAIIDFDLHHGDGSQSIAWAHNTRCASLAKNGASWKKTAIGYFSLHDINSYPCELGDEEKVRNASICIDNAHGQNIWNVHLEPWKSEAEFWELYETKYSVLLEKTRKFLKGQTSRLRSAGQISRGAIFLSAGFDASEWESSGMQRHNVNVPTEFYARLTRDVAKIAAEEGTSVEGRIVSVLEGGYSDRALFSGILSHLSGLAGDDPVPTKEEDYNGLGYEMGQRIGSVRDRRESLSAKKLARPYESSWWNVAELEAIEALMAPPPPEAKAPRQTAAPTYSSPTQSSQAKVATPKVRRSISGLSSLANASPLSRPPSPPPPEVPWMVAAHELSKLLIPADRQTGSCKPEDLSAEATRVRRDRQSLLSQSLPPGTAPAAAPAAPGGPTRVSMRERKQVKPFGSIDEEEEERKNRRKTVAGSSILAIEKAPPTRSGTPGLPGRPRHPGRRLSAASTVVSEAPELELSLPASVNGSTRPTTSQSSRPESSMSMATTAAAAAAPLTVKKTRTANPAKKDAPRAPRTTKKATASETAKPAGPSAPSSTVASAVSSPGKPSSDMDQLTKSMKKIKINVITAAQREAREKAKMAADQPGTPSPVKQENSPVLAQTPRLKKPSPPPPIESPDPLSYDIPRDLPPAARIGQLATLKPPSGPTTPIQEQQPYMCPIEPQLVTLPASSPVLPSTPQYQGSAAAEAAAPSIFIPYQPEGATPEAIPQTQPLQFLPPNTVGTPSPMKRSDLPVFTSTSAIPFAGRRADESPLSPRSKSPIKLEAKPGNSVWEIAETPQK